MTNTTMTTTTTVTQEDIRGLLNGFAAAIELDQIWVDALPRERFHPAYDDGMWREWRRTHIACIDHLLLTVIAIPSAILEQLTLVAITYEPAVVGRTLRDLFMDAAEGRCPTEVFETAAAFFNCLISVVREKPKGKPSRRDARALMLQWLPRLS